MMKSFLKVYKKYAQIFLFNTFLTLVTIIKTDIVFISSWHKTKLYFLNFG